MSGHQLDLIDRVMRHATEVNKPFGGIELYMVGDFYQLPPISRDTDRKYAFQSDV